MRELHCSLIKNYATSIILIRHVPIFEGLTPTKLDRGEKVHPGAHREATEGKQLKGSEEQPRAATNKARQQGA